MSTRRAQSAMEYLMTYGWAILIIAVVLGVLFQLGVFSQGNLGPKASPGSCTVQRLLGQTSLEGQCNGQLPEYVATSSPASSSSFPAYVPATTSIDSVWGGGSWSVTEWLYPFTPTVSGIYSALGMENYGCYSGLIMDNGGLSTYQLESFQWSAGSASCGGTAGSSADAISSVHENYNTWVFAVAVFNYNPSGTGNYIEVCTNTVCSSTVYAQGTPMNYIPYAPEMYIAGGQYCCSFPYSNTISVANVQLYNTSLSQSEINALYQEGIGGAPIKIQNLVGWWPLNGNGNDYSGNNNNAKITGGTVVFNSSWSSQYTPP